MIPQFTIRKLHGKTEIKMADDPALRADIPKLWPAHAPLLSELEGPAPSFHDLKTTQKARDYLESHRNAGETFYFLLRVCGENNRVSEKEVLIVDHTKKVSAISRWTPHEGV